MRVAFAFCAQLLGNALQALHPPVATAGPAIEQFEIKQPTAEPGRLELQIINDYSIGNPLRAATDGVFDGNTVTRERHGLEFEMGLSRYVKTRIGLDFEKERLDEPGSALEADAFAPLRLTEIGLETVVVIARETPAIPGIGWLTELNHANGPEASTLVFGPLFQLTRPTWSATLNLTFARFFGAPADEPGDDKWDFGYAAQIKLRLSPDVELALEGYGTVDRIGAPGSRGEADSLHGDHDQHRLGPILYVSGLEASPAGTEATFGLGILAGLNDATPDATVKLDLEVEF